MFFSFLFLVCDSQSFLNQQFKSFFSAATNAISLHHIQIVAYIIEGNISKPQQIKPKLPVWVDIEVGGSWDFCNLGILTLFY